MRADIEGIREICWEPSAMGRMKARTELVLSLNRL
jgi:hypothetical protein